ncbi:helix-turn-helix domain-containing protein [Streptomyces sp. NPDC056039]|uniref:helix-turn-helix domain-containing protein n=1 Tax=Streptomyces sp. NPDC056039 TaxID=3345687 RepID=UPI0035D6646B
MPSGPDPDSIAASLRSLGERIRAVREEQKLSQEDVGRATKLGRSAIDRIEQGALDASIDDLLLIAYVLDVPLAELVVD